MIVDTESGEILDLEQLKYPPRAKSKPSARYKRRTRKQSDNRFFAACVAITTVALLISQYV